MSDFAYAVSATSAPRLLSCRKRLRLAGRNTAQVRSRRPGFVPMTQPDMLMPIQMILQRVVSTTSTPLSTSPFSTTSLFPGLIFIDVERSRNVLKQELYLVKK